MRFLVFVLFSTFTVASVVQAQRSPATYASASKALADGEYEKALVQAKELCKEKPGDIDNRMLLGRVAFANADMKAAIDAYDKVIEQRPDYAPQLWQRGLALYYAGRFNDGVRQFETHQTVNSQDVENSVWHLLCKSKAGDVAEARENMIPIKGDKRIPMSQIYEMFSGRAQPGDVLKEASKATSLVGKDSPRYKLQLYYAHLYIGLFHEINGANEQCLESLRKAVKVNPLSLNNFMGQVARVHLQLRRKKK